MKKSHVPVKERETSSFNFNVFSNYQVLYLSHYGPEGDNGFDTNTMKSAVSARVL